MTIQEAIRKMAAAGTEPYCKVCTVDAVDEDARTVDCTPLDEGAPLVGVNLQANQECGEGVVLFPAVGSYVVVSFLGASVAVVVLAEKVDKIDLKIGDTSAEIMDGQVDIAVRDTTAKISPEGCHQRRRFGRHGKDRAAHAEAQRVYLGVQQPHARDSDGCRCGGGQRNGAVKPRSGHGSGNHEPTPERRGIGLRG